MPPIKSVLVIDDDASFRMLLVQYLRIQGWAVFEAGEGEDGIKLAKANQPDVVLCDLLMPRGNGFQVCRALRRDESLRSTRIIVTTGRPFETDRQAALAAGADEYLVKPIDPDMLVQLVRKPRAGLETAEEMQSNEPSEALPSPAWIRFWGVRGSIPAPGQGTIHYGGNTSCVEVRAQGQIIILDAGTGLRLLGKALTAEFPETALDMTLLLTHTHWDHIQGLPFFAPLFQPRNQLQILGFEGARHRLESVLNSQMESPFFPIGLSDVPANVHIREVKELGFNVGPVRVQTAFAHHPGICVGYRLFTEQGSIAFFPDNESHPAAPLTGNPSDTEFVRGERQKLVHFLRGTDMLIMDTQYDAEEYKTHRGWGHGCLDEVVLLSIEASVKQLFLFHHDPEHDDRQIDQMREHARKMAANHNSPLRVEAAREGDRWPLG